MPRTSKTSQELQNAPVVIEETIENVDINITSNGLLEVYIEYVGVFYIRKVENLTFSDRRE
jgi:hypothetical protein